MVWKAKAKAALMHLGFTFLVGLLVCFLVFKVWYPDGTAMMMSGIKLVVLILVGEITLGPLLSFVIYDPRKSTCSLVLDYSLIIAVQLSALFYGVNSVYQGRPVYIVFVSDRLEIISASELSDVDLKDGGLSMNKLPQSGPDLICVERPSNPAERTDLLFSGLAGKDIQVLPKYYRECRDGEIENAMLKREILESLPGLDKRSLSPKVQLDKVGWLPIVSRFGAWTAVYPDKKMDNPIYLDINPFSR